MQFAQFCIRTYATKVCESLQPAASWGHQNADAPNSFCAEAPPRTPLWELTTLPHIVGWGGGYPLPIPSPSTPSASRSRRLWHLGLGAFGACWFAPNLFFVPARLLIPQLVRDTPPKQKSWKIYWVVEIKCWTSGCTMETVAYSYSSPDAIMLASSNDSRTSISRRAKS